VPFSDPVGRPQPVAILDKSKPLPALLLSRHYIPWLAGRPRLNECGGRRFYSDFIIPLLKG